MVVCFWVINQMDNVVFQIFYVVNVIMDGKICYVVIQVVDSEIVVLGVFFDGVENVVAQQYVVLFVLGGCVVVDVIFVVFMEGCNFDNFWVKYYMSQMEMVIYQVVVMEQFVYLFRCGVSGYVKIFWFFVK